MVNVVSHDTEADDDEVSPLLRNGVDAGISYQSVDTSVFAPSNTVDEVMTDPTSHGVHPGIV